MILSAVALQGDENVTTTSRQRNLNGSAQFETLSETATAPETLWDGGLHCRTLVVETAKHP